MFVEIGALLGKVLGKKGIFWGAQSLSAGMIADVEITNDLLTDVLKVILIIVTQVIAYLSGRKSGQKTKDAG